MLFFVFLSLLAKTDSFQSTVPRGLFAYDGCSVARPPHFRFEHRQASRADRAFRQCLPRDVIVIVTRRTPAARTAQVFREVRTIRLHASSRSPERAAHAREVESLPATDDHRATEGANRSLAARAIAARKHTLDPAFAYGLSFAHARALGRAAADASDIDELINRYRHAVSLRPTNL